jgi:hypothetical protein
MGTQDSLPGVLWKRLPAREKVGALIGPLAWKEAILQKLDIVRRLDLGLDT